MMLLCAALACAMAASPPPPPPTGLSAAASHKEAASAEMPASVISAPKIPGTVPGIGVVNSVVNTAHELVRDDEARRRLSVLEAGQVQVNMELAQLKQEMESKLAEMKAELTADNVIAHEREPAAVQKQPVPAEKELLLPPLPPQKQTPVQHGQTQKADITADIADGRPEPAEASVKVGAVEQNHHHAAPVVVNRTDGDERKYHEAQGKMAVLSQSKQPAGEAKSQLPGPPPLALPLASQPQPLLNPDINAGNPCCSCEADLKIVKAEHHALKLRTDRTESSVANLFATFLAREANATLFADAIEGRRWMQANSCRGESLLVRVTEINAACCNGTDDTAGQNVQGSPSSSGACEQLPVQCTPTCAPVFIAFREECVEMLEGAGFVMQQVERLHERCLVQMSTDEGSCGAQIGRRLQRIDSSSATVVNTGATAAMIIPLTIVKDAQTGMLMAVMGTGRRSLQQGGAQAVQELRCECGSSTDIFTCLPVCDSDIHGFELLLTVDQTDLRVSCKLHRGFFSWAGAVSEGSYFGEDIDLFHSIIVSGAEGMYVVKVLTDPHLTVPFVIHGGQEAVVTVEMIEPAVWGSSGITVRAGGSLSMTNVRLGGSLSIIGGSVALTSCVTNFRIGDVAVTGGGSLALTSLNLPLGNMIEICNGLDGGGSLSLVEVNVKDTSVAEFTLDKTPRTWEDSAEYCEAQGAAIVSLHSEAENDQIRALVAADGGTDAWLGGRADGSGNWHWVDQTPWDYLPSNDGLEGTAETYLVFANPSRGWHDWHDWSSDYSSGEEALLSVVCREGAVVLPAVTGVVTATGEDGSIDTADGGWLEFDPPGLLTIGSPQFAVVSGPCTVANGRRCVGRPDGYLPNERCEITVEGYGTVGSCPAFDVVTDQLTLPSGRVVNFGYCPVGLVLTPGQTLAWTSNGQCQGGRGTGANCGSTSGLGGGWQICFADGAYYHGCFANSPTDHTLKDDGGAPGRQGRVTAGAAQHTVVECAVFCSRYTYMGLQSANECYCGNVYGMERPAATTDCDTDGVVEDGGIADQCGDGQVGTCQNLNAVYTVATVLEHARSTCSTGARTTCGSAAAPATRCAGAADQSSCCCEPNNNAAGVSSFVGIIFTPASALLFTGRQQCGAQDTRVRR